LAMSSEPAAKKIKLDLSEPDEPLTRNDVIYFQKEALFRKLNLQRTNLESVKTQYELSKKQCNDISIKLGNIMALVVTLARFLIELCETDEEKKVCEQVSEGDETIILQQSDSFIKLLTKYSGLKTTNSIDTSELATNLKNWEKEKTSLINENKQLEEEVEALKEYYQKEIRKYDREDSATVNRIFRKIKEESEEEKKNEITSNDESNGMKKESSSDIKKDNKSTENLGNLEDAQQKLDTEFKITDLQSQIEVLTNTIGSLKDVKSNYENEIKNLKTQLALKVKNEGSQEEVKGLIEKVKHLTNENQILTETNDEFMSRFQQLNHDKEIYTGKLMKEFETAQEALKKHNGSLEKDLVRIRATRDDLLAKMAILEAARSKCDVVEELQSALDIMKKQYENFEKKSTEGSHTSQDALMKELQDLESAFKELSNLTNKKYSEYLNNESVISKLTVEKTKADQKYFAAMRSKDSILIENKNLSKSLSKSNELILQLKESEKLFQQKIENLTKQLELSQNNELRLINSNKTETMKIIELNSQLSNFKKSALQNEEQINKEVSELIDLKSKLQSYETENKTLVLKEQHLVDKCDKLQKSLLSGGGDSSTLAEELENFRSLVYCSLCSKNWKSTAIKTCGHVFCDNCCKGRLASRMRKCPTCNKAFSSNDLLSVHL
ncbi:hypothetical protein Kpol_1055p70, partial [Vanderwaltozyma polyspora DSM 70294]